MAILPLELPFLKSILPSCRISHPKKEPPALILIPLPQSNRRIAGRAKQSPPPTRLQDGAGDPAEGDGGGGGRIINVSALCSVQRRVATMLPWLVIPLIAIWVTTQLLLPAAYRFEVTSPRLACVSVLLPRLSLWREERRAHALELQKLRKTATRRGRQVDVLPLRTCLQAPRARP